MTTFRDSRGAGLRRTPSHPGSQFPKAPALWPWSLSRRPSGLHPCARAYNGPRVMRKPAIKFLQKPSCTTCRKAKAFLEKQGATLELRSLDDQHLSEQELDELIGERDHLPFLNTRNELYRSRKMKDHPPSLREAIRLMAATPNLIRRPVVLCGKRIVLGYDETAYRDLLP